MDTRTGRFTRVNRLNQPAEFKQAFKSRHRSRDDCFLVLANRNNKSIARLGMAISRKASTSAVRRNTIKRLVREYFRQHIGYFRGWDIVVVANKPLENFNRQKVRSSLDYHSQRIERCD